MSPARSKRKPVPHRRSRADIARAIAAPVAIVVVTSILVWLLRPGPPGVPATGGLMNRQPRASWLVGVAIGAAGIATWWILFRSKPRTRARARIILPIALGVVLVATVAGGVLWPGGLLRHDVAPAPPPPTTTTRPSPTSATTTGASTTAASTTVPSSTVPSTTVPSSTVPTTTAPSAGTATTGSP